MLFRTLPRIRSTKNTKNIPIIIIERIHKGRAELEVIKPFGALLG